MPEVSPMSGQKQHFFPRNSERIMSFIVRFRGLTTSKVLAHYRLEASNAESPTDGGSCSSHVRTLALQCSARRTGVASFFSMFPSSMSLQCSGLLFRAFGSDQTTSPWPEVGSYPLNHYLVSIPGAFTSSGVDDYGRIRVRVKRWSSTAPEGA